MRFRVPGRKKIGATYATVIIFEMCQSFVILLILAFFGQLLQYTASAQNANIATRAGIGTVNIGALLAYNSTIGKVAKKAIELAVDDVNADENVLNGTRLVLMMMDSNCSAFIGTAAALELMQENVVAIVGPQSSVLAHIVSHIASELQVPLLSFAATDSTLSSYQYPYFLRFTHSDYSEMTAIAAVIGFYGWRKVVAVYIDDDYGRNGISALEDALGSARAKIVYKAPLPGGANRDVIGSLLVQLALMDSRVLVVHMNPDAGLELFSEARYLGMLSSGYVWIATDWLSSVLDSTILDSDMINSLQGVIGLRPHTPNSDQQHAFTVRWNNLQKAWSVNGHLNAFGLYAYDAVWAIAYSVDTFLRDGDNISFVHYPQLPSAVGSQSGLGKLNVFNGGPQLRKLLLQTNFTGLNGPVQLDKNRDLLGSTFEIINVAGTGFRKVSYWSNQSGLSVIPPENRSANSHNQSSIIQQLYNVIWPGESKLVPRGWVFPNNGKHLLIGVPRKKGFQEFVQTIEGTNMMKGFCIDVFVAAVNLLPYAVPYTFIPFGPGNSAPNYDELVQQVALKNFDAVVGDIAIDTNRSKIVDFTQPYIESGLVVVAPVKKINTSAWAFMQPFTPLMWGTTGAFFLGIGVVVWILEHRTNPEFRGPPKQQVVTIFWFAFSTLFFAHRENTLSTLGRAVLIVWLFVVLIINSSYTANLTTILTVQQLSPTIKGIDSLIASNTPIGYQTGSFVRNYLSKELNIAQSRLIPLDSPERYAQALSLGPSKGGVAAIVDELPDIQLFLSNQCGFTIVGQQFSKGGWGFVFPKDSPLAIDMSTAILTLSENGDLQRIHDKWFSQNRCGSQANQIQSNQLSLRSFWGLFLISGLASISAFVAFLGRMIYQFIHNRRIDDTQEGLSSAPISLSSRSAKVLRSFATFVDERETDERRQRSSSKHTEKQVSAGPSLSHSRSNTLSWSISVDPSV